MDKLQHCLGLLMTFSIAAEKARVEFMSYVDELLEHSTENSRHEITRRESDAYDEGTVEDSDEEFGLAEKRISGRACAQIVSRITNSSRKGWKRVHATKKNQSPNVDISS